MLPTSRRTPLLAVLVAAASIAAACSRSSGPRPTLDVAITLVPPVATTTTTAGGGVTINCDAKLQATATGAGEATWVGGTVYFFRGGDESKIFDSSAVTPAQLTSTWGSGTITGGETRSTTYRLTASEPFGGLVEFRYQQSGGRKGRVARIPVHCAG